MSNYEPTAAQMVVYRTVVEIIVSRRERGINPAHALEKEVVDRVVSGDALIVLSNGNSARLFFPKSRQEVSDVLDRLVIDEALIVGPTANDRYFSLPNGNNANFRSES